MSQDLEQLVAKTHVVEVVRHGEQLLIPNGMDISDAIDLLKRRRKYEGQEVSISQTFNVFPWDGGHALNECIGKMFGWVEGAPTPGFFGSTPPEMRTIEVGFNQSKKIPWGRIILPTIDGYINTGADRKEGRLVFAVNALVRRKDEATVQKLFDDVENYLKDNSIYAGKAIKMRFCDNDGNALDMPEPKFMDTKKVTRDQLIYSQHVMDDVEINLFTPIERIQDCIANDIPVKRGVLLGGPYGTGKTLAATMAARLAEENGVTYIYVPRADELAQAIDFAKQYQTNGCVVFCEDIDRSMGGGRSVAVDDILNIVDGIDTKGSNIITVLTTNHIENINPAMLRPGRLDSIINVTAPDAAAIERLLRMYSKGTITAETDLTESCELLDGTIPAVVEEVVKRAKLAQLRLSPVGTLVTSLSAEAILHSSRSMQSQVSLLAEVMKPKEAEPTFNEVMGAAVNFALNGTKEAINASTKQVNEIHEYMDLH